MDLADALSRLSPEEKCAIPNMNLQIHQVCHQFSTDILERIRTNTGADPELVAAKEQAYKGWPSVIKDVPQILKPYWSYRDEITIEDGIIMKGSRIIIPRIMQSEIVAKLHAPHQGTVKTKLRARTSVFWRKLKKDIDNITNACHVCQELQGSQQKEPIIQTEILLRP